MLAVKFTIKKNGMLQKLHLILSGLRDYKLFMFIKSRSRRKDIKSEEETEDIK